MFNPLSSARVRNKSDTAGNRSCSTEQPSGCSSR